MPIRNSGNLGPYPNGGGVRNFCVATALPPGSSVPVLAISDIIEGGSGLKMLGVNAGLVVAFMSNDLAVRNWPDIGSVANPMCELWISPTVFNLPIAGGEPWAVVLPTSPIRNRPAIPLHQFPPVKSRGWYVLDWRVPVTTMCFASIPMAGALLVVPLCGSPAVGCNAKFGGGLGHWHKTIVHHYCHHRNLPPPGSMTTAPVKLFAARVAASASWKS
jgi:hypothetical protein